MENVRIKIFGSNSSLSPIENLKNAFVSLGCIIVNESPDLIFDLTGFFEDAIECGKKYPKAIKIFNLLNADINNTNWGDGRNVRRQLLQADIPTTVSKSTKKDIKGRTGIDCEVIYFPMKSVTQMNLPRTLDFLYVGRLFNKEKRFKIIPQIFKKINIPQERFVTVGPEDPGFGYYAGLVTDEHLNLIYNYSKYLFCPCEHEGSMSMLEAIITDCFPLVCHDNEWVKEFELMLFACDYDVDSFINKIGDIENNTGKYVMAIDELKPKIIEKFDVKNVARRIIDLYYNYKNSK